MRVYTCKNFALIARKFRRCSLIIWLLYEQWNFTDAKFIRSANIESRKRINLLNSALKWGSPFLCHLLSPHLQCPAGWANNFASKIPGPWILINPRVARLSNDYPVSTNYYEIPSTLSRRRCLKFKDAKPFETNSLTTDANSVTSDKTNV